METTHPDVDDCPRGYWASLYNNSLEAARKIDIPWTRRKRILEGNLLQGNSMDKAMLLLWKSSGSCVQPLSWCLQCTVAKHHAPGTSVSATARIVGQVRQRGLCASPVSNNKSEPFRKCALSPTTPTISRLLCLQSILPTLCVCLRKHLQSFACGRASRPMCSSTVPVILVQALMHH